MNERILVIEDEPALRETLEWNLRRESYEVKSAADGIGGLQAAREWKPDLLLLDLMLPGLTAWKCAASCAKIPISRF